MLVLRFQHVSSRFSDLLVASSCQWGKLQNFEGFQRGCGSFCVAVLALRGIFTYLIKCRKSFLCDRRNTFASFSICELHFSRQAQHFGELHRHFVWQAQHFRRVVLAFSANRNVGAGHAGPRHVMSTCKLRGRCPGKW